MVDVNNVVLIGRLVRDAILKYTTGGTAVTKIFLAVNKRRKSGDSYKNEAQFFEVVIWGKLAESLNMYLKKGKQIAVIGELSQEKWEQNGENRSKTNVTAATIQLLGGGSTNTENAEQKQEVFTADPADEGDQDDIPF
jgi:single-strand DNA-binding protein